jgi:hypothetical protein
MRGLSLRRVFRHPALTSDAQRAGQLKLGGNALPLSSLPMAVRSDSFTKVWGPYR